MDEIKMQIVSHLSRELNDEIAGVDSYLNYADMANQIGNSYLEKGLCEIAKDEYTHAKFIRDFLIDSGSEITTEQETKYSVVKERISRKFRRI